MHDGDLLEVEVVEAEGQRLAVVYKFYLADSLRHELIVMCKPVDPTIVIIEKDLSLSDVLIWLSHPINSILVHVQICPATLL